MLASGQTGRQVAKTVGVTPQTISEWNQLLDFRHVVDMHLGRIEDQTLRALHGLRLRAVERLGELLESNPSVALRTAQMVLELTDKSYSSDETATHEQVQEAMRTAMEVMTEHFALQERSEEHGAADPELTRP